MTLLQWMSTEQWVLIQRTWNYQSWRKSCANVKNEHGKFMTIQCTRTTALKDSADKSTLMQEMIAKCSQSSITQEPSVAHHDYEERSRRWRWIRRRNNAHMVYSPFSTQEAPQEVKEQKRNEEKWRQKANLWLSTHLSKLMPSASIPILQIAHLDLNTLEWVWHHLEALVPG